MTPTRRVDVQAYNYIDIDIIFLSLRKGFFLLGRLGRHHGLLPLVHGMLKALF